MVDFGLLQKFLLLCFVTFCNNFVTLSIFFIYNNISSIFRSVLQSYKKL